MSLKDELQSVTPEEVHWALLSFSEQTAMAFKAGNVVQSVGSRSLAAEKDYPGIASLSKLVLQSVLLADNSESYSNLEALEIYAEFLLLALAQIVEIRENS